LQFTDDYIEQAFQKLNGLSIIKSTKAYLTIHRELKDLLSILSSLETPLPS